MSLEGVKAINKRRIEYASNIAEERELSQDPELVRREVYMLFSHIQENFINQLDREEKTLAKFINNTDTSYLANSEIIGEYINNFAPEYKPDDFNKRAINRLLDLNEIYLNEEYVIKRIIQGCYTQLSLLDSAFYLLEQYYKPAYKVQNMTIILDKLYKFYPMTIELAYKLSIKDVHEIDSFVTINSEGELFLDPELSKEYLEFGTHREFLDENNFPREVEILGCPALHGKSIKKVFELYKTILKLKLS